MALKRCLHFGVHTNLMFPLQPANLGKHQMNESIFGEVTVSIWMALLDNHMNIAT